MALRNLLASSMPMRLTQLGIAVGSPALRAAPAACLSLLRHYAAAQPSAAASGTPVEAEQVVQGAFQSYVVPIYDLGRRPVGNCTLDGDVFDVPIRKDILHRVVRWQLAKSQQGTHRTKTRSEVSGGGRKPRPQKGSGQSRQGTIRAPQWRGGGTAHGPVLRSHEHKLYKRVRRLGIKCVLSAKLWEGRLLVVDSLRPAEPKTVNAHMPGVQSSKTMSGHIAALLEGAPRQSAVFVDSDVDGQDGGTDLRRSMRNIPGMEVLPARGLNVYSLLRRDYLIISTPALETVVQRLRAALKPWSPRA